MDLTAAPRRCKSFAMPRAWRNKRARVPLAGAVSAGALLVLALLGEASSLPWLFAAFGLGLLAARLTSRSSRARAEPPGGDEPYRPLFDPLPLGTLVVRASDLELTYVSPEAERLLDIPRRTTHAIGDLWSARLHDLDRERVLGAWHAWLGGACTEPFRAEYRLVASGRRDVYVEDVTIFVRAENDMPATIG